MERISLEEIINATKGELKTEKSEMFVTGVSTDSRTIEANQLFVPIKGEFFNGHDYIKNAYAKGCRLSLTMEDAEIESCPDLVVVKVKDTLKALQSLASYYYKKFNTLVVGVTGSTGKTSTKEMIWSVLSQRYNVLKNKGNLNNEIGLPLTVFNLSSNYDIAVFEMGMSNLGEIEDLCEIANPKIGVITNIGVSHIENLKTQDNIFKAKMEIASGFDHGSTLIINQDDNYLSKIHNTKYEVIRCSVLDDTSNIRGEEIISLGEDGIEYTLVIDGTKARVRVPQPGLHNVGNSLLAAAVGYKLKLSINEIAEGLAHNNNTYMRLDIVDGINGSKIINDCYNASPDSMKSALGVLSEIGKDHRTIAVLADMFELGDITELAHREAGRFAANLGINIIVAVGKAAKHLYQQAYEIKKDNCYYFEMKEQALTLLNSIITKGDIILVKGSRGMEMEKIVDILKKGEK